MLIGHDWGAEAAYGAAAHAPDRWRRLVTLAVPPASLDPVLFSDYEQLKRNADGMDLIGTNVSVASLDDLIRMKRAAGRNKDLIEVENLSALREVRDKGRH